MKKSFFDFIEKIFFRPFVVWATAFVFAGSFAGYSLIKFSGDKLYNQFYYVVPIIFPFVFFLSERGRQWRNSSKIQNLIDFLVVLTAMWRVIGDVSFVSGHSLFLTYVVLTARTRTAKIAAAVVLIEVICLKVFVWNDWLTLINGVILGVFASLIRQLLITRNERGKTISES